MTTAPAGLLEDFSAIGHGKNQSVGVLLLHGYTGSPASMRPWAEYLNGLGYTVSVPRLPGHGRTPEELNKVKWNQWVDRAEEELVKLFNSCDSVFVVGLSMGGGLTAHLATKFSDRLAGIILVNPMIHLPGINSKVAGLVSIVKKMRKSVGDDIKRPNTVEYGYDKLPLVGLKEVLKMHEATRKNLASISCPVMIFHSKDDHVLPVSNTEIIWDGISSTNKQRIELINSYHVATLDFDQDVIHENSRIFFETLVSAK